ncbi:hypothetical protein acsn021_35290 [Anaerocolumna cellulosilytica]|uniref:DUF4397 domain-containing protein n=1 Tax=Anaerocolumna cellulosilytica TaxID=433286 RepID=A0A6S6R964_9FIRM|nr:DUF4397 domain-containing protein [Anaerocolumna cellulosilytica]MBB5195428.1 hypothetical protein [Anaerocolumna cellulosilytica]BCJ95960.1 hypothetical protein acsn021_35290 [Anaerocolumna cellulosilytica]
MHYYTRYTSYPKMSYLQNRTGNLRVFHAVADAPNVDVYANDTLLVRDLTYGEYTEYLPVPNNNYRITLYEAGTRDNPLVSNMFMVTDDTMATIAAVGTLEDLGLLSIPDNMTNPSSGNAKVRFVHLSPDAPAVDITLQDGTVLLPDVSYKQMTQYIEVSPGDYTLEVRVAGTDVVALTVSDLDLEEDTLYSIYAIGLAEGTPELEAVLVIDQF